MGLSCEDNLEREAIAMMRDWKQSEESYPCRRTVIVGLVGLLLSGSGITWLTRQCHSSPEPANGKRIASSSNRHLRLVRQKSKQRELKNYRTSKPNVWPRL
jgi:hypothetical protein